MRILFFIDNFPGFSETFIYNQIYFLIDSGICVDIISLKKTDVPNIHRKLNDYGLSNKALTLKRFNFVDFLINVLFYPLKCISVLFKRVDRKTGFIISNYSILKKLNQYDVIHAHYGNVAAFLYELEMLKILHKKPRVVVSFHGNDILPAKFNFYRVKYDRLTKNSDVLLANSKYTSNLLSECFPHFSSKIHILPASIDDDFINLSSVKEIKEDITFLYCGRFIELKNPIFVVKIFKSLVDRGVLNIKLNMVGDGELFHECVELVRKERLEKLVHFFGYLPQELLINVFKNSDVFLFPGKVGDYGFAETQGLVIQEAQAMRLPVLVSDVGGMKYGLLDGEEGSGFVLQENDLEGFIAKCYLLVQNADLRKSMGERGFEFVKKNFTSSHLGPRLLNEFYNIS